VTKLRIRLAQQQHTWGEIQNVYKILAGRPEGKRSVEKLEYWQNHNIKLDLTKIRYEDVEGIQLVHHSIQQWVLVNMAMTFQTAK
jgi:hypothetical protein